MKIPKTLKIGGHTFQVEIKELDGVLGKTTWDKPKIQIDKDVPKTIQEATLIHEIFHCINTTIDGTHLGHALLDSLSEQFYQVLKDNHLLRK